MEGKDWISIGAALVILAIGHACATTPARTEKGVGADGGFSALVPACTAANLRARLQVADGSWLWCVETETPPSPRWEQVR